MLSRVRIQNFKSIGEPGVDLELAPFTFLVGPNGGGKSSILEAVCVSAQRSIQGKLVNFLSGSDISGETPLIKVWFDRQPAFPEPLGWQLRLVGTSTSIRRLYGGEYEPPVNNDLFHETTNERAAQFSADSYLIASTRGDVPYTVGTGGDPNWVGVRGETLLRLLATIFGRREYQDVSEKIARWADRFGVTGLKAGLWNDGTAGADYLDTAVSEVLNLSLSSSGARQILTVITQLSWAEAGSLLMVEEPEISLHPQAQLDVIEMFA